MKRLLFLLFLLFSPAIAFDCSTSLVGVMERAEGVYDGLIANLTVFTRPGSGRVWVDTMPLTKVETQVSARLAKEVSCELLGFDCSTFDFFYVIRSDFPLVGGPSAGAPMAICTLASLLNLTIDPLVAMTGTINPDGSVGPVGAIDSKASVLGDFNLFIVPEGSFFNSSVVDSVEVSSITDAFGYYTGYKFIESNVSSASVVNGDYTYLMSLMSSNLISDATYDLNGSLASSFLNVSRDFFDNSSFYSSASYAVQSLIYSFFESNTFLLNDSSLVSSFIDGVSSDIDSFRDSLFSGVVINHLYDLEGLAVTFDRVSEASSLVVDARSFLNDSLSDALFSACFAKVRLITAVEWSNVIDYFSDSRTIDFDVNHIKPLVLSRLELARDSIAYSKVIVDPSLLFSAEEHLDNAISAYLSGDYFYSLFESLKARAEANLLMEVRGFTNVSGRISFKRESALRSVSDSMSKGYVPLLSLSFLEYSKAFSEEPYQELVFLSYAKEFSSLGYSLNEYFNYAPAVGVSSYELVRFDYSSFVSTVFIFIVGFVLGLVAVLAFFP
ncbi:MAG TPA: hypothetical protein VI790_00290 [Candidatus Nanoarchaeia archaeon]|nr:hypothetical protein [Candidatus Nanoarchaeia archaeon]